MDGLLEGIVEFAGRWYPAIILVVLVPVAFIVGRVTKRREVKEIVVWKYHTQGSRSIKGKVDNLLRPVIEKGRSAS